MERKSHRKRGKIGKQKTWRRREGGGERVWEGTNYM